MNGICPGAARDVPSHPHLVTAAIMSFQKPAVCMQASHLHGVFRLVHCLPAVGPDVEPVLIAPAIDGVMVRVAGSNLGRQNNL